MSGSILAVLVSLAFAWAQQATTRPAGDAEAARQSKAADEQAVRDVMVAYVEAFNAGNVDALIGLFTERAQYVLEDGTIIRGRADIRQQLTETLQTEARPRLAVTVSAVEFPRTTIAVVRGVSTLTPPGDEPVSAQFRAACARRDGKWLIRSLQEGDIDIDALAELSDFIGTWRDDDEEATITIEWQWTPNRRFITRSFTAVMRNGNELSGTEVIGWDPAARAIRSWLFDSEGSFGQSVWSRREDQWIIKSRGVLPDGSRSSAVFILTPQDEDSYTWESVNREVDGELLPDIGPFLIVRTTQPAEGLSER